MCESLIVYHVVMGLLGLWLLAACHANGAAPTPIASPRPTATQTLTPIPQPLTIVTIGDSLTSGDKDESAEGGGWPRRLQPVITARRPGSRVINLALPGWTSSDVLHGRDGASNQIDQAVAELTHSGGDKIATIWIGTNDLFYLYEFSDPTPAAEAREADRFARDLDEIVRRLSESGARVYIARLHDPSQGSVQTSGVFTSISAREWVRMSRQAEKYNVAIRSSAARYQAELVDIPATNIFTTPELMYEDGIHPNTRGYNELTKVWFEALTSRRP